MRPQPTDVHARPRQHLPEAVKLYGLHATVNTSLALLGGSTDFDRLPVPLTFFGGAHARLMMHKGYVEDRGQGHWPRTWGARALLYVWAEYTEPDVVAGLADPHWRVREMVAKVVAARELPTAADALLPLVDDPVARVQVAAMRASAVVGESEHLEAIGRARVQEPTVQIAASSATRALRLRLDRVSI